MPTIEVADYGIIGQYANKARRGEGLRFPPTGRELVDLFTYLKMRKLSPVLIGSLAVAHHLGKCEYRPATDADIFVQAETERMNRVPPPPGWYRDKSKKASWVSPTSGQVDFITSNYMFVGSQRILAQAHADLSSPLGIPVIQLADLFRFKLASPRDYDFADLIFLARAGKLPPDTKLGSLNQIQQNNLKFVKIWSTRG